MIGETLPGRTEKIVNESPLYLDIRGLNVSAIFSKEKVESAMDYNPLQDDLHLATYPKSGTTWTQQILRLIFDKGVKLDPPATPSNSVFIESTGAEGAINMRRPGIVKMHVPANMWADPLKGKYILVVRNPKDVVVSFYHHQRTAFGEAYRFGDGKFEDFFELFMNGPMEFNDYFDHLLSWYPYTKKDNYLIAHYEELKDDPKGEILRMAKFMGEKWHKMLLEEQAIFDNVLELSSFGTMKKAYESMEITVAGPQGHKGLQSLMGDNVDKLVDGKIKIKNFVRSGKVGGWREMFTDEMNKRMNEKIKEKLMPVCPEIVEMWRQHGIMD